MSIKLRNPPIIPKMPELSLWLMDLKNKVTTADSDTNALITALKTGVYFGNKGQDGSYRILISGVKLNVEKRISGAWTKVFAFKE